MLRVIGRLILVPLGFILASIISIFVLVSLGSERITHMLQGRPEVTITAAFDMLSQVAVLSSAMTVVPALLVVLVGEIARLRSVLYYVAGSGAALASVPLFAQLHYSGDMPISDSLIWPVFATAGFFGGLTYWLVAGRKA